jgi:hypothetical protein
MLFSEISSFVILVWQLRIIEICNSLVTNTFLIEPQWQTLFSYGDKHFPHWTSDTNTFLIVPQWQTLCSLNHSDNYFSHWTTLTSINTFLIEPQWQPLFSLNHSDKHLSHWTTVIDSSLNPWQTLFSLYDHSDKHYTLLNWTTVMNTFLIEPVTNTSHIVTNTYFIGLQW